MATVLWGWHTNGSFAAAMGYRVTKKTGWKTQRSCHLPIISRRREYHVATKRMVVRNIHIETVAKKVNWPKIRLIIFRQFYQLMSWS